MAEILNFERDGRFKSFMDTVHRINRAVEMIHGERFDLKPGNGTFKANLKSIGLGDREVEIRMNDTVPNSELFSLAAELVRPADEQFKARQIFEVDSSYHEGSQTVGFDIINESGEAKLVATGRSTTNVPKAGASVSRELQAVGKLMAELEVVRDDIQLMSLRRDRGISPLVDMLQEKIRIARKNIARQEDYIIWTGGNIEGIAGGRVNGVFDFFSTTSGDYSGSAPTKGKQATVVTGVAGLTWAVKTADEIIKDIATAAEYIVRNDAYIPRTLVLPQTMLTSRLALRRTSDTDSTPLIEWIKRAFLAAYNTPLEIVGSSALTGGTNSGTQRKNTALTNGLSGFILMDNSRENMAIASVEDTVLLPSQEDTQGTIRQIAQMKTGGFMAKHPSAMTLWTGI